MNYIERKKAQMLARASQQNETLALRKLIQGRLTALDGTRPTQSAAYLSRVGAASDAMRSQAEADQRDAAARGLSGSTYELAQSANRSGGLLAAMRAASADAEGQQQVQGMGLLQMLLGAQGMVNQDRYQREAQRQQQNALLGQLLGTAVSFIPGIGPAASAGVTAATR